MFKWLKNLFGRLLGRVEQSAPSPREFRWTRPVFDLERWVGADRPPPMMWKDCNARTRVTFKAELTCSHGHAVSLRGHSIAADGLVSPSVVCLTPGCDFHDHVRLSNWTAGPL
jgi:hypothetical protein